MEIIATKKGSFWFEEDFLHGDIFVVGIEVFNWLNSQLTYVLIIILFNMVRGDDTLRKASAGNSMD